MENKTAIIILSITLVISIFLNITLFYAIGNLDAEWENAYSKNYIEWCEISNKGNEIINDFIDQLIYYDEEYKNIPYMINLDCYKN